LLIKKNQLKEKKEKEKTIFLIDVVKEKKNNLKKK